MAEKKKKFKRLSKARVSPTTAWAAISYDRPPEIWYVAWYRENLPDHLRHIRVRIVPLSSPPEKG